MVVSVDFAEVQEFTFETTNSRLIGDGRDGATVKQFSVDLIGGEPLTGSSMSGEIQFMSNSNIVGSVNAQLYGPAADEIGGTFFLANPNFFACVGFLDGANVPAPRSQAADHAGPGGALLPGPFPRHPNRSRPSPLAAWQNWRPHAPRDASAGGDRSSPCPSARTSSKTSPQGVGPRRRCQGSTRCPRQPSADCSPGPGLRMRPTETCPARACLEIQSG